MFIFVDFISGVLHCLPVAKQNQSIQVWVLSDFCVICILVTENMCNYFIVVIISANQAADIANKENNATYIHVGGLLEVICSVTLY